MKSIRVAVVGLGIGQQHIEAYQALSGMFEVVAVSSLEPDISHRIAKKHQIPHVCRDLDEICGMQDVDVVDLCTPPYLHFDQLQQALKAGKHAICEKPLVGSLKEVDELDDLTRTTGKTIMPIFQYRFGHGVQKLKRLVDLGIAGKAYLSTVEVAWRRRADYYTVPWRGKWTTELGGTLLSHGVHSLDVLCYVLGTPRKVFARAETRVNPVEVEDCLVAVLEMPDGSLASFAITVGSARELSRHRFCFANLVAESNVRPYTNSSDPWKFIGDTPEIAEQIQEALAVFKPGLESFEGQFEQYYQAMSGWVDLPVNLEDARRSVEVVTAAYHSVSTGQDVHLPISNDHPAYAGWSPQRIQ